MSAIADNDLAIDVTDLQFAWQGQPPLLSIARFGVARGERVFLRGPSGSGKSTLLGLIGGVLTPTAGSIRVFGAALQDLSGSARDLIRGEQIGFIFQMFNLVPYLSVLDNALLPAQFSPARLAKLAGTTAADEARRLLGALGLGGTEVLRKKVVELSVGQQQRVAAARALLGRPGLVVADEPTSSLDADAREEFLGLLLRECAASEATLLFVSHDAALARRFDRSVSLPDINQLPQNTA